MDELELRYPLVHGDSEDTLSWQVTRCIDSMRLLMFVNSQLGLQLVLKRLRTCFPKITWDLGLAKVWLAVAVSRGYDTCFGVKACDGFMD